MAYKYEFDSTSVGDFTMSREDAQMLQGCYKQLKDELAGWNKRTVAQGAPEPYKQEVEELKHRIEVTNKWLGEERHRIHLHSAMIGSLRLMKAALMFSEHHSQIDLEKKKQDGWPSAAVSSLEKSLENLRGLIKEIPYEPSNVLWEVIPPPTVKATSQTASVRVMEHDVFISHASEDKDDFVRALAERLKAEGLKVWYDEFALTVGDSLRQSIDKGLANSRFGVVVLSPQFFEKDWPQLELDGLVAREIGGVKVILPVWHKLTRAEIVTHSPILAGKLGTLTSRGMDSVVSDLLAAIRRDTSKVSAPAAASQSAVTAGINPETVSRQPSTFSPYAFWGQDEMLGAIGEKPETATHPSQVEDRIEYRYGESASFYLRLIPVNKPKEKLKISALMAIAQKREPKVLSRVVHSGYPLQNAYGAVLIEQHGMSPTPNALSQILRNGEIWGVTRLLNTIFKGRRVVPMVNLENFYTNVLDSFVSVATAQLDIKPPFVVEMGATGLQGVCLTLPPPQGAFEQFSGEIHEKELKFEAVLYSGNVDEQRQAVEEFVEELYDLAGIEYQKTA